MKLSVLTSGMVKWPVRIPVAQDGGTITHVKMTAHFKRLGVDEFRAATAGLGGLAAIAAEDDPAADFLRQVVLGWTGVFEEDGKTEVPFDEDSLEMLLSSVTARVALMSAYNEMIEGRKAKN